jgi:hypothetical protein
VGVVLRPIGDQPASVYWVRRGLLVLVVLLVVALVWWWWPSGGDAEPVGAEPTPTTAPTASPTPTETATPEKTKTKKPKPELAPACADNDLEITVTVDAETYPPGRQPSFTFAVENVSDETCSRDVGQAANELRVTSGGSQVWSSDDCNPGGQEELTDLDPEDRFVQTVSWDRTTSSAGCPADQPEAQAGTYQVVARNGDLLSEPAVFVLE